MITLTTAAATSASLPWTGGPGLFAVQIPPLGGSFGSGNVILYASFDAGTTFTRLAGETGTAITALTAAGMFSFRLPPCLLAAVLADSTAATVEFTVLPT